MSDYIPQDVLLEIFLRLPAKSLVRFVCVCKKWYFLISDPGFVSLYTHFSNTRESRGDTTKAPSRLIIRRYSKVQGKEVFTLNYDDGRLLVPCQELYCPVKSSLGCFEIVGSCYGLLCLTDPYMKHSRSPKPIIVWNPLVGKSMILPVKHDSESRVFDTVLGFGFDSKSIDYKVVRIVYSHGDLESGARIVLREVEIFDLSVGAWRSIRAMVAPPPTYVITQYSPQAFLNGYIHWIGKSCANVEADPGGKLVVAVFNVGDETFGKLELPEELANDSLPGSILKTTVSVIGKLLSLIRYYRKRHWQHHPFYHLGDVWIMKEYGVAESWIKRYKISPWGGFSQALSLRGNGEIIIVLSYGELVSYDPESLRITPLEIRGIPGRFFLDAYVDSLFLWKGTNGVLGDRTSPCNAIPSREHGICFEEHGEHSH